jgi:hypothetical protein
MPPSADRDTVADMEEGTNLEVAHALSHHHQAGDLSTHERIIEIAEAVVLALVAVAAAWSGYQAAKWDGHQAFLYGTSSRLRVQAGVAATAGGQQRLLDVSTFNTWIQAHQAGDEALQELYVRRFSPEYKVAFEAWLQTDPFTNPDAPAGPSYMPEYHNALLEQAKTLNEEADHAFSEGTDARATAERYVAATVLFATVLFLIALSQRFRLRSVRVGIVAVAAGLLIFVLVSIASYPRA